MTIVLRDVVPLNFYGRQVGMEPKIKGAREAPKILVMALILKRFFFILLNMFSP